MFLTIIIAYCSLGGAVTREDNNIIQYNMPIPNAYYNLLYLIIRVLSTVS